MLRLRLTTVHLSSLILFSNAIYAKYQPYLRFGIVCFRSQEGTRQGDPVSFLLFALAIHPIVKRTGAEYLLIVHRWYENDEMQVGKIYQEKLAFDIIAEYGALINFIHK